MGSSQYSRTLGRRIGLLCCSSPHQAHMSWCLQLLRSLKHSVATLQVSGGFGVGPREREEATLEVRTDRVWLQGRASQRRLGRLQVRAGSPRQSTGGAGEMSMASKLAPRLTNPSKLLWLGCSVLLPLQRVRASRVCMMPDPEGALYNGLGAHACNIN